MAHMNRQNTTIKTYPRTLHDAFPNDRAEYACALEHHPNGSCDLPLLAWAALIIVGAVLAVAVVT